MSKIHTFKFALFFSLASAVQFGCGIAYGDEEAKPFLFPSARDYPILKKAGKTPQAFLPKQWHIIARATGDLNADGLPDQVLVIRAVYPKFAQKNENLGTSDFDTNPRSLVILLKKANGSYELAEQNNYIIGIPEMPTIEDPFQSISVSKAGVLKLQLQMFQNAGSWWMSNYTYKFRMKNNHMDLIGSDHNSSSRANGLYTLTSCNFLTGKKRVDDTTVEPGKVKVTHSKLKRTHYQLADFKHMNDWSELPEKF